MAIGPTGRTVQCVRCKHVWVEKVKAPAALAAEPALRVSAAPDMVIRPPTPGAGLPALPEPPPSRSRWGTWFAVFLGLAVVLGVTAFAYRDDLKDKLPPELRSMLILEKVRALFGPPPQGVPSSPEDRAQLTIDIDASKVELVDGRYVVRGAVVNNGRMPGSISTLKVVFKADDKVLGERSYNLVEGPIAPGMRVSFSQMLEDPPAGTTNIVPSIE